MMCVISAVCYFCKKELVVKRCLYVVCAILLMFGCEEKGKQFNVTSSQNKILYAGDTVQFEFSSKKGYVPDSVVLRFDLKSTYQTCYETTTCTFVTEGLSMGDRNIIFEIYRKGKKEVHNRSIRILSDIVPANLSYEVIASFSHDKKSYTQGLQYEQGKFYESAGLYGESSLRLVDVKSGAVAKQQKIDDKYFAEGLTIVGDSLFQLTWRENTGFIYDKNTFEKIGVFSYETEGWGLCYDGTNLVMSDGSEFLYFYNPKDFSLVKKVGVFDNLGAISNLNELEFVDGFVYANVYQTDKIVKINPSNGKVAAQIDFSNLLPEELSDGVDVLNGIAWNPQNDNFYITGKLWPRLYQVRLFYKE